jgi:hypothetical protein
VSQTSIDPRFAKLRNDLEAALDAVYMSPTNFLSIFDQTPAQAIAAFRKSPEAFGKLRFYLGQTSLQVRRARVLHIARLLHTLKAVDTAEVPKRRSSLTQF